MYKIDKQKDILHNTKNYSQCLRIAFNGVQTIKILNHYAVHLKHTIQ